MKGFEGHVSDSGEGRWTVLAAIDEVAASDTRALVIEGRGPAFSAGHDLREMTGRDINEYRRIFEVCSELMMKILSAR